MPLFSVMKCWRGRTDCESFDSIEAEPDGTTQEQLETLDFEPKSFICVGCVIKNRTIPQDAYRFCFKNQVTDEMTDNDEQDLAHMVAVISRALAIIATRRVNGGMVEVPTVQGGA